MLKQKFMILPLALILTLALSGCLDLFTIPSISVSNDNQWVAFLTTGGDNLDQMTLQAVNLNDGSIVAVGEEGSNQGAFDWNPTATEIAYYNLAADGTPSVRVSDLSDAGQEALGVFAFPRNFWVTQMAYSPDGNWLALAVILLPEDFIMTPDSDSSIEGVVTESALYLANLADGTVTAASNPGELTISTVAWSPDGAKVAFTAWKDGNGDGTIDSSGAGIMEAMFGAGDITDIYVYDIASQSITAFDDGNMNLSPDWLGPNTLVYSAYVLNFMSPDVGTLAINSYDLTSSTSTTLVAGSESASFLSVSASPDGSKIAYIQSPEGGDSMMMGGFEGDMGTEPTEEAPAEPIQVIVANADGSNPTVVYETPGDGLPFDVPVWSQDGAWLFLSNGNPLGSVVGSMSSAFATGFTEGMEDLEGMEGVEGVDELEGVGEMLPTQMIVAIDLNDSANTKVVYEGSIASPALMQFAFSMSSMASGFDDMEFDTSGE
ncbi:MAG: hypothetical protein H6673_04380 [Anaerolineales bacterium]|nr:hypothetical protein [Anaerolineales bacterium]